MPLMIASFFRAIVPIKGNGCCSSQLFLGTIAGAVFGIVVCLVFIGTLIVFYIRHKRYTVISFNEFSVWYKEINVLHCVYG